VSENENLDNNEEQTERSEQSEQSGRSQRSRSQRESRGRSREAHPRRRRGGGRGRRRRKEDYFVVNDTEPNYKDVDTLRRFITDRAKIRPRRQTGLSAKNQRKLAQAVKRARHMALLPFTDEQTRR
jgi:small subunit ribosomal protein S18